MENIYVINSTYRLRQNFIHKKCLIVETVKRSWLHISFNKNLPRRRIKVTQYCATRKTKEMFTLVSLNLVSQLV